MAKPLSPDLRERVVAAIDSGMSRRQAATHFEVSAASAIRWCQSQNASGSVAPGKSGGDHRPQRIEAHAAFILAMVETPDVTLKELKAKLIDAHDAPMQNLARSASYIPLDNIAPSKPGIKHPESPSRKVARPSWC